MSDNQRKDEFVNVLEMHKKIIYKVARAYTDNIEERNDLIQEIIIQIWSSFENYNPTYKYSTWIYRIALNVSISYLRKNKRKYLTTNDHLDFITITNNEYEHKIDEQIEMLYGFISKLKPLDKAIILLYLEEKPNFEIGEILGISASNVSTRVNRIKKTLKQNFINN